MIRKHENEVEVASRGDQQHNRISQTDDDNSILYLGIDLGTSRCAISCSNGVRECVGSVVGWPRDTVSQKILGSGPLFGDDALDHRLSLEVEFPLADGNLRFPGLSAEEGDKSRRAAETLMQQLVVLSKSRPGQLTYAVIGAPAEATRENKQAIIEIAKAADLDGVMVVSEPFSVAYGVDTLDDAIVIDIGAGTIDLCRLHGTLPEDEDQVTIFKAGNYVDEELAKLIQKKFPEAQFTINMIKQAKERFSGVVESEDRAIVTFPVNGKPTQLDVTAEMREAVGMLVPEILKGIQELVSSFDPEFQHRIRNNVVVSGGGSQIFGLRKALEEGMEVIGGGKVTLVEEPTFAGSNGALKLAREMPTEYWEQLG